MNIEAIRLFWEIGVGLISAAAFVIAWRNRKNDEERKQVGSILDRLQKLETTLQHQPTTQDIYSMRDSITNAMTGVSNSVSKLSGILETNVRMTERMNDYLIQRNGDK